MTQRALADASLRVKYQWPEAARVKLDSSPLIQHEGKAFSRAIRAIRLSSLMVSTR